MVRSVPIGEKLFIGDLNGRVGTCNTCFEGVHVAFGYGSRNEDWEDVLSFALAYDMMVANIFFRKRESHLLTFSSGQHSSWLIWSSREEKTSMLA